MRKITRKYIATTILFIGLSTISSKCQIAKSKVLIPYTSSIETAESSIINLQQGIYDMKLKVWLDPNTTIENFYTYILNPWTTLKWEFNGITRGEWVELKQELKLKTNAEDSGIKMEVPNNPVYGGGKGTFYIDDISFTYKSAMTLPTSELTNYKIYPNPVSNNLYIELPEKGKATIYNVFGAKLKTVENSSGNLTIPVTNLLPGVYWVKINSGGKTITKNVIVRRIN